MIMRLLLLLVIAWVMGLTESLFTVTAFMFFVLLPIRFLYFFEEVQVSHRHHTMSFR
jgi:predicted tellurium resistance membrane protein TerC